ncbi:MAG: TRAP transporter small permease [Aquincola tertiaricarbonis]|uniref:TRAP transporter small permease n=1 Tax=Aquincola TaxID=391952 RepID=UPI0009F931C2|nr:MULTISPECIES: TRAP transporter small permease [Aquincola]MCR5866357.1 TRAP transporter small permease [Aquincola sp. J276]
MAAANPTLPEGGGYSPKADPSAPVQASAAELAGSFAEADQHRVSLAGYTVEDWICVGFFWVMAALVFLQFFTRYVMNDSFAWTEELAVYCLMPIVFIGASACVRRSRHIQVNFLYRYLPPAVGRAASTAVDLLRTGFFLYAAWLVARYALAVNNEPMTTIDWNKSHVYWLAFAGFAAMGLRSIQVSWENWRRGYSNLERPEAFEDIE